MTEAEWLACTDWGEMCRFFHHRISDRKVRLATTACCRAAWHFMNDAGRSAVEFAERYADGEAAWPGEEAHPYRAVQQAFWEQRQRGAREAARASWLACYANGRVELAPLSEFIGEPDEIALLREVAANPFRPRILDRSWVTPTVSSLASAGYDERELPSGHLNPARLAVLSDALEEVGCTDPEILTHLRSPGPHVRGCWAVDLLLDKK